MMKNTKILTGSLFIAFCTLLTQSLTGQNALTAADLLQLSSVGQVELHPDGTELIYAVSTPLGPNDDPGPARTTYLRMTLPGRQSTPLFEGELKGTDPQYSPDGSMIAFLAGEKGKPRQVWAMPAKGGPGFQLTRNESGVSAFRWQPGARGIGYIAVEPASKHEKELEKRGYGFIFYEENLKNNNLFLAWYDAAWNQTALQQLTLEGNTWDFEFNRQGTQIAATISPMNLIDHRYMFRKIYLVDLASGTMKQVSENQGKLGNYAFSPNGSKLAYAASLNINDHAVSQAYVADLNSGKVSNLTPGDFRGHVSWVGWKDENNLLCYTEEGVYPVLSSVPVNGNPRKILLNASSNGIIFGTPEFSLDQKHFVFSGSTPSDRSNLYHWDGKNEMSQLTALNPALTNRVLGKQEVIQYQARDGKAIEGILIYPVGYEAERTYPLVVYVHGGPESHHSNGWLSRYSTPAQVMAGKGYMVLFINYRASTGYGVDFGMEGFMDPAGKEFDDIADGIEWVAREKGADPDRVGLAGGSYGGYASGWFATYYTNYVKAVCMFVGISDNISKRGTTDIPYEELYVHSGKPLEEQWQMNLERSPIYWAHQSRTATLIYGGAADTRVHPSQSIELYRRMKMNKHPAVRLVQYPGEGHGNRKQVGQTDVLYRQMAWFDWYVRDLHPLDGPMPPLDISDQYGLDWNQ